ncbi:protein ETHYLENE-INSENSITIVE 2 isoform X1 [Typha angustifolia]|uniref:protein ETHYLENE-INSENSITIVE 2 isoform X1 n=1 Tax=Typha angustifolia TaxID=59011 RepID=UPI003C2EEF14
METMSSKGSKHHLFPSLGPALMVSMGYIDLGKWLAAVDGGARFGYDLVLLVLFFNFTAIFCQYLATCIGMVAERSLAEICSEEYGRAACIFLGVQAELSMITSDLTMILGVAQGLNLLIGVDLFTCLCFATVVSIFFPFFITLLEDNRLTEALHIGIAGFALLFYVLGVLVSQPEIPLAMNVIFPKLSMESTCSLMALLGANIMAHNFYIQSSVVQQQRRHTSASIGALSHDHFFAILFVFTGIFLVNHVLMNSAAVSSNPEVLLSFEDAFLLMDQIFKNPVAPMVFFLVLLFSSQINALICNSSGQLILRHFIGINLSLSVHHLLVKALTIIPALYCAKILGAEGTFQLFLFCQIIQAMLLPSSFIPLFRVASSRLIMGSFRLPRYLEIFALFAFVAMLGPNIIFSIEMSFGNSSWANSLRGNTGGNVVVPYTVLLLISCASIAFTLYLAVTPLKSASNEPETQLWAWHCQKDVLEPSGCGDPHLENISFDEDQDPAVEPTMEDPFECRPSKLTVEFPDLSEAAVESGYDSQPSSYGASITVTRLDPTYPPEEPKSLVEMDLPVNEISGGEISDSSTVLTAESKGLVEKDVEGEADVHMDKDNEKEDSEKPLGGAFPPSAFEDPRSFTGLKEKGYDTNNDSGSLSKLSGLGRAARRQLAAILDEFWGHLFDFHGKLTQEASMKKLDVLLGLDLRIVGSSVKVDTSSNESSKNPFKEAEKGVKLSANSGSFISPSQKRFSDLDLSYGLQMGSPSWSQNMQLLNTHVQNSSSSILESSEKLNSNYNMPPQCDARDYQPATIHGYQIASYLKGINAGRTPYSNISLDQQPSSNSSFIPSLGDSVMYAPGQNRLVSFGTSGPDSPTASQVSRLQTERPYYDPSLIESSENIGSSVYAKKYHSSPDISALIAASRSSFLNDGQWGGPIGPRPSLGRMTSERSHYVNLTSRAGVPIAFDELSPPKLHANVFSSQSNLNPDAKSLWSRQPFEQLFGVTTMRQNSRDAGVDHNLSIPAKETFSYAESETKLLQSLRFCIMKLLKLEGSEWLFRQNGGYDEGLIDRVAATERYLQGDATEINQVCMMEIQHLSSDQKLSSLQRNGEADAPFLRSLPNCGDNCIWRAALVVSFGVWCIRRTLELSLVESRPELWGKYTYVLNRLQGILEPAFSKPRQPLTLCSCLEALAKDVKNLDNLSPTGLLCTIGKPIKGTLTTASMVLDIIKDVEVSVSGRKGRTGTAAGDVAFPKGKENLSSVLKRYKRRLSSKSPNTNEITSSRKIPSPTPSVL